MLLLLPLLLACSVSTPEQAAPPAEPHPPKGSTEVRGVVASPPFGARTVRLEAMGLPYQGGGVLAVERLHGPGPYRLCLEPHKDAFNLWIFLDQDGDEQPEFHFEHPDNPLHVEQGARLQGVDVVLDEQTWAQDYPPGGPDKPIPRHLPGGLPVRGALDIPGFDHGLVQVDITDGAADHAGLLSVGRLQAPGPFRIDVPAGTRAVTVEVTWDEDLDGQADKAWTHPGSPLPLGPDGISGLELAPEVWTTPMRRYP